MTTPSSGARTTVRARTSSAASRALGELEDERLSIAQTLGDLGLAVAAQLQDLGMDLADALLGPSHLLLRLPSPSLDLGLLAFERQLPRLGNDAFGDERRDGFHLPLDDLRPLLGRR